MFSLAELSVSARTGCTYRCARLRNGPDLRRLPCAGSYSRRSDPYLCVVSALPQHHLKRSVLGRVSRGFRGYRLARTPARERRPAGPEPCPSPRSPTSGRARSTCGTTGTAVSGASAGCRSGRRRDRGAAAGGQQIHVDVVAGIPGEPVALVDDHCGGGRRPWRPAAPHAYSWPGSRLCGADHLQFEALYIVHVASSSRTGWTPLEPVLLRLFRRGPSDVGCFVRPRVSGAGRCLARSALHRLSWLLPAVILSLIHI